MDVTFNGYRIRGLTLAEKKDFARDNIQKIEQLLGYGEKNIQFWNDNLEKIEKEIDKIKILPTVYKNLKDRYDKIQSNALNRNTSQFANIFQVPELRDLIVQKNIKSPKNKEEKLEKSGPLLLTMERASEDLYNEARRDRKNQCFSEYDENGKKRIMSNYEKASFCDGVLENDLCKTVCDTEIITRPDQLFSPLKEKIKFKTSKIPDHEIHFKGGVYHIKNYKAIAPEVFKYHHNMVDPMILPKYSLRIHKDLEYIGNFAFMGEYYYFMGADELGLQSVIFEQESKLEHIGQGAFLGTPLKEIDLSTTKITELENSLFAYCKNLTNVKLPQNLVYIKSKCFENCESLKKLEIPNTLRDLGNFSTFEESGLESIDLSKTDIKIIPQSCFKDCKNLKTVKLPSKLEMIEAYAFKGCTTLEFFEKIPKTLIKIGRGAFEDCNSDLKEKFIQNGFTQKYVDRMFSSY